MKFHHYKQLDAMDCGPTCLRMIAKYYGKEFSIQQLRDNSFIKRTGVNLLGLSEAAESIGLRATAIRTSFDKLIEQGKFPCILHWNQEHFVVLYKIKKKRTLSKNKLLLYVADPAHGLITYTEEEFKRCWVSTRQGDLEKGVAMLIEPTPQFYETNPIQYNKISLLYLIKYLHPYKNLIAQLIFGLFVGSILQLVLPFLTQSIVDQGIGNMDLHFIQLILIAQLVLVGSRSLVEIIRRWILLHISTRVNVSLISDFLVKLMKLPMRFFDTKMAGDLIRRIDDHKRIEVFLTQSILNSLFSILTILVLSLVLSIYNIKIFFTFLIGSLIYVGWISSFMKKRAELDYKNFSQMANNQNNLIQLIYGMQEIKLTGCEQQKRWEWEGIQATLFRISVKSLSLGQWQQTGATLINEIKNILITIMSATAVLDGHISLGAMLSIQYIIGSLDAPIGQIIHFMQQAQDARLSLERLGEIHNKEDEEKEEDEFYSLTPQHEDITLNHVDFTYGSNKSKRVIQDLSLVIPTGKTTAIVGLSGSGKTTLIKLILGFYPPNQGDIKIGNIPLNHISFKEWRKHCGVVMQEGYIFSDTIASNIAPGTQEIDKDRLLYAVKMANIQDFIEGLPLKYNTKIGNTGTGLSQGQKQRILIARTIYKNPNYIFFDEATNALDANNEKVIMENLNRFFKGKTVLVVAHRLSTVKNADQIVVLEHGKIIEKGSHKELISLRGAYYNLVKDQLELSN